jgi:cytoskeletal protein RodZ
MTDKIFDEFIKGKLAQHEAPVPTGMWARIMKEKKRRPVGLLWSNRYVMMGILFALVAGLGLLIWNLNTPQTTTAQQKTNTTTVPQTLEKDKQTPSISSTSNSQTTTESVQSNQLSSKQSVTATSVTNNKSEANNTTFEKANTFNSVNKNQNNTSTKEPTSSDAYKQSTNANLLSGTATNVRSKKVGIKTVDTYNNTLALASKSSTPIYDGSLLASTKSFVPEQLAPISMKQMIAQWPNKLSSKLTIAGIRDCPSANGNARDDWYFEAYASPDYTIKHVTGNDASSAYLRKKDSTESMRMGYTLGGRIVRNFGEHILVKAGLQFSQINERFTLRTENERRTTIVITTRTVTDALGNTTIVSDTTSVTQIGYLVRTSNNVYRSIEIPLMAGYEFGNKKWKASVNGGVIVNLASWYKGKTLDTSFQTVSLTKGTGDVYQHSVGLSLYGSVSIIKPIGERVDVFAEPYIRHSISNLNSNSLGYAQRFTTMGLSLGVRYKLNGKRQHL